mgnify:CR=1 FL=1
MIGILDFEICNLTSVSSAVYNLGFDIKIIKIDQKDQLKEISHLIIPGVGSFSNISQEYFENKNFVAELDDYKKKGKPILGICLGMQILFETSHESTSSRGLGLISGEVKLLSSQVSKECIRSVPNIGYNLVSALDGVSGGFKEKLDMLSGYYYFLHSYAVFDRQLDVDIEGITKFAEKEFSSFFLKENLCGIQFHPERSGEQGLYFLDQIMNHFDIYYKKL